MENKFYFASSTGGFYQSAVHRIMPEDALEISEKNYLMLLEGQSDGSEITSDAKGLPMLERPAGPSAAEKISAAEAEKLRLLSVAALRIAPLQDAADLKTQIEGEQAALERWKAYRIQVNRIDSSAVTDIVWPDLPDA
jgi:hypothetical protein